MNPARNTRLIFSIFILGSGAFSPRGEAEEAGPLVRLPPFIVEELSGPNWRYAEFPGHEILSRCDDGKTKRLFLAFSRAHELLGVMLPVRFQIELDVPKAMIFYDEELWPVAKQDTVAAMLRLNPPSRPEASASEGSHRQSAREALVPRSGLSALGLTPRDENRASVFFGNMCLSDTDSITTFAIVSRATVDAEDTYLTPAYVETLVNRRSPQLPVWFRAGFLRLYGKLKVHDGTLTIMRPSSSGATSSVSDSFSISPSSFVLPNNRRILTTAVQDKTATTLQPGYWGITSAISLSKTLANGVRPIETVLDERAPANGIDESFWLAEIELFVRWGIDPTKPARVDALMTFLPRSDQMEWRVKRLQDNISPLELREATRGEIARIKGEWERLQTRYVRRNLPDLEADFLTQARKTLRRAFDSGDRDPRLLGSLGLLELDAGESKAARDYFEGIPNGARLRPRVNFELARLRYEATDGHSIRNDGKITAEQANPVIAPLLVACRQAPSIPEVYELLADVCVNSVASPQPNVIAALKQGVMLYPGDGELVYRMALLLADTDRREAVKLVGLGLQHAPSEADKLRFLDLGIKLRTKSSPYLPP